MISVETKVDEKAVNAIIAAISAKKFNRVIAAAVADAISFSPSQTFQFFQALSFK